MGCQGEPVALKDEETASRAARLAAAAESALPGGDTSKPVYIIGTEIPIPGGAMHALEELELTTPEDARRTSECVGWCSRTTTQHIGPPVTG